MDRVRTDGVAQEERTRGLGIEVVLVVLDRPARSELTVLEVLDLKRGSDTKGTEIGGTTAIKDEKVETPNVNEGSVHLVARGLEILHGPDGVSTPVDGLIEHNGVQDSARNISGRTNTEKTNWPRGLKRNKQQAELDVNSGPFRTNGSYLRRQEG